MDLQIIVPPTHRGSLVTVCGEAPGAEEVAKREGFVGKAGRLLDKILAIGGLDRSRVNLTNVVKRPPDGGFDSEAFRKTFYEKVREETIIERPTKRCRFCSRTLRQHSAKRSKVVCSGFEPLVETRVKKGRATVRPTTELNDYIELLRRELLEHKPNLVIAAGGEALKALCGVDGITNYRGSVLESTLVPGLKVIPILHPSAILRGAQWQEVYIQGRIIADKVVSEMRSPEMPRVPWVEYLRPTVTQVIHLLGQFIGPWTLDIETRGGSIACIGLGCRIDGNIVAVCIPIQTTTGPYYSPEDEYAVWLAIDRLMKENPQLIGQNLTYDLDYLLDYGLCPSGILLDTMLGFHYLYAELPKGLDFLNMRYTKIPYYKEEGKTWGSRTPDDDLWRYNIKDVVSTLLVGELLLKELSVTGAGEYFVGNFMSLFPLALEMQKTGFIVDDPALDNVRGIVAGELQRVHSELVKTVGKEVNLGSPQQVAKLLYVDLGLPVKKKRGKGTVTTDEDALMELLQKFPDRRELKLIIAERHLRKSLESYIDAPVEGR